MTASHVGATLGKSDSEESDAEGQCLLRCLDPFRPAFKSVATMRSGVSVVFLLLWALGTETALAQISIQFVSPHPEEGHFGSPVVAVGDVTGDGRVTLLEGEVDEEVDSMESAGRAYDAVVRKRARTITSLHAQELAYFGFSAGGGPPAKERPAPAVVIGACHEEVEGDPKVGRIYRFTLR